MKRNLSGLLTIGIAVVGLTAIGTMGGCAYTHTQTGKSTFLFTVAGVAEEGGDEANAALSADLTFEGYTFKFKGDPLALGMRFVQDIGSLIRSIGAEFKKVGP